MFTVDWTQHAVGHGGFHTGRARVVGGPDFNWIFDCGAKRSAVFDEFLKAWAAQNQQPVDWLFISHFDNDHVSGLETLMSRAVVRDVMVPFVNERELALQLLHEIDRGNLQRAFFELVADPAAFFLARGADRVTFFRGRRPDGEALREGGPEGGPHYDDGWRRKVHPQPGALPAPRAYYSAAGPRVLVMDNDTDLAVVHAGYGLRLKPHRASIVPYEHKGLMKALQGVVGEIPWQTQRPGLGDLAWAIAQRARTAAGRAQLRKAFKAHVGSSNRASLSLLSAPHVADPDHAYWHRTGAVMPDFDEGVPGWLNTGDAELLDPVELAYWEDTFAHELKGVRVLALPHHGSDKNSDEALQKLCPDALLVAHVKAESSKHPGLDVAGFAGPRLACVTNQPGSEVRLHFHTP